MLRILILNIFLIGFIDTRAQFGNYMKNPQNGDPVALTTNLFMQGTPAVYVSDLKNYISDPSTDPTALKNEYLWMSAGIGGSSFGWSTGVDFSLEVEKDLYTFHFIYNEEFLILGPLPIEKLWDFGVLYGKVAKSHTGFISGSAGLSMVGGVKRGNYLGNTGGWFSDYYENIDILTFGFPLEAKLIWTPLNFLGVGLTGYANINLEKSYGGGLLCIIIGKLR
jgi:hypothetical protein